MMIDDINIHTTRNFEKQKNKKQKKKRLKFPTTHARIYVGFFYV